MAARSPEEEKVEAQEGPYVQETTWDSLFDSAGGHTVDIDEDEFLGGLPKHENACFVGPVQLQARISSGGMGVVYRGHHVKLDIDVAVKFLLPHLAEKSPDYVLRFEREARLAAKLNNENLVRVFAADSEKNYHYVIMELVCGETARDRVSRKGRLPEREAMEILLGATRGLDAAHRKGIIHRDIKPENIMIDSSGVVKLADLGIAKVLEDSARTRSGITQPGLVMGTPSFMAPEQFEGAEDVSPAADIYSMGSTLYFLLTGKVPFSGNICQIFREITSREFPDIRRECPEVSESVVKILRRCTQKDPVARYPTASELLDEIEQMVTEGRDLADDLSGTVTGKAKVSTPPAHRMGEIRVELAGSGGMEAGQGDSKTVKPFRRRRAALTAIAIVLGACSTGVLYFAINATPETSGREAIASQQGAVSTVHKEEKETSEAETKAEIASVQAPRPESHGRAGGADSSPLKASEAGGEETNRSRAQALAARDRQQREMALDRARELLRLGDRDGTLRVLQSVKDWGDLHPQSAELQVKALLELAPAMEQEALEFLATLGAEADVLVKKFEAHLQAPAAAEERRRERRKETPRVEGRTSAPATDREPQEPAWAEEVASTFQVDGARAAGVPLAREIDVGGRAALKFLYVPRGIFRMGGGPGAPRREVTLTRGYYLGIHEVTWEVYREVMGSYPAGAQARSRNDVGSAFLEGSNARPVTNVTWEEASRFCRTLSHLVKARGGAVRFRLPTEAEWEYACRAGATSKYPWGDHLDEDYVWCWINSGGGSQPVGLKKPTAWGFFDMLGNASEWCADSYGPYSVKDETDPKGPGVGTQRVLRGGSWKDYKGQVRPSSRWYLAPDRSGSEMGFRVVMDP